MLSNITCRPAGESPMPIYSWPRSEQSRRSLRYASRFSPQLWIVPSFISAPPLHLPAPILMDQSRSDIACEVSWSSKAVVSLRWLRTLISQRSEEHTSELQSLMRISYAVFCLKKKQKIHIYNNYN